MDPVLAPGVSTYPNNFDIFRELEKAKAAARNLPQIGEERTIPIGTQVYAGKRYGYQTPEALSKITPEQASSDRLEQAYIRELQKKLREKAEAKKTEPRGENLPTSTGQPSQKPASQTTDAELKDLLETFKRYTFDPEYRAQVAEQDTSQFIKRALVTQALQLEATRENTRRKVEIENIQAWRELEKARIDANTRQALAFGQTVALAMVPNQGLMQGMNQAFANAMAPYENFALKG